MPVVFPVFPSRTSLMARVVCQVAADAKRITFRWSEGETQFEPYFLDPDQTAAFWETVEQADTALADLAQSHADNKTDALRQNAVQLATLGYQLRSFLFPETEPAGE